MALATYSDLKTAIAAWLVRDDLTTRIPDFVALAEARINRELRCREMVTDLVGTTDSQTISVPDDFIEVVRFVLDTTNDKMLEYRSIEDAHARTAGSGSVEPSYFTIFGSYFVMYPPPGTEYTYAIGYYAKVPALSDTNTTNWLLTKAPDLYLFGALKEGSAAILEPEAEAAWDAKFRTALTSLNGTNARAKRTSGPWRSRVMA